MGRHWVVYLIELNRISMGGTKLDDLLIVAVTFIFTVAGLFYVAGCERL